LNEFDLIRRFFCDQPVRRPDVSLGIGDDAAIVIVPPDRELVVASDMLVAGIHFPELTDAYSIGHKALAVNLSDMAAMGADPTWFTLSISLPSADTDWLSNFTAGLLRLGSQYNVELIGGDTTRGPLTVSIQILGTVPHGQALRRSGAQPGDRVYVTGCLGDAALGLSQVQGKVQLPEEYRETVVSRLNRPSPRIAAGIELRGIASACIDISDGLVADLGHVLAASSVAARIEVNRVPLSPAYQCAFPQFGWTPALSGGDDFELCFTVPPVHQAELRNRSSRLGVPVHEIGVVESGSGLRLLNEHGAEIKVDKAGFDHFQ